MPTNTVESVYDELHRKRVAEYTYTATQFPTYSDIDIENIKLMKWSVDYLEPVRIRLVMKDRHNYNPDLETDNLVYYDSFDAENNDTQKNNVLLRRGTVENSNSSAGIFAVVMEDHERNIDITKVGHNNIVIIQGKKLREQNWRNLLFGICRQDLHEIYGSIGHNLHFSGFGTGVIANETVLDFKRTATRTSISSISPYRADPKMFASQLIRDVYEAKDVYPEVVSSKNTVLRDRGNYDLSGINMNIKESIAGINAPLVIASRVLTDIAALIGADIWVDEYNTVRFDFLQNVPDGIVLKGVPQSTDNPDHTSYFFSSWSAARSTDTGQGFANKLWSNVDVIDIQATGGSGLGGYEALFNMDWAQQLPAGINIKDLSLLLQRNGAGTDNPAEVFNLHGHVVKDVENTPTGQIVALFDIPLEQIPLNAPAPVFIPYIELRRNVTVGNDDKTWIILYERGRDISNTILWFKGTDTDSRHGQRPYAARGSGGDHASNDGWSVAGNSFSFAFSAFNRQIQRVNAYDPYSMRWYGTVEKPVTVPLASDPATVDKWLHQMLVYSSKPKLIFNTGVVSIPNIPLRPRTVVSIREPRLTFTNNVDLPVDLNKVTYTFDANSNSTGGVGTRFCNISLTGVYDRRVHFSKRRGRIFTCCPNA